jgi:hypothetical protein
MTFISGVGSSDSESRASVMTTLALRLRAVEAGRPKIDPCNLSSSSQRHRDQGGKGGLALPGSGLGD